MTNRDRLVLAAGDLFHRNGYAATSVEDILERTGVARSNFYYYFDGKLDLAREVFRRWVEDFEDHLHGALSSDGDGDAAEGLHAIFSEVRVSPADERIEPLGRLACPMGPLVLELAPHDEEIRSVATEFLGSLGDALRETIADGARRGQFDGDIDPEAAAAVALATLQGALLLCHTHGRPEPLRKAEVALLELLSPR
jgi:TetR/AcrR family transcriptional repressor of nem operon